MFFIKKFIYNKDLPKQLLDLLFLRDLIHEYDNKNDFLWDQFDYNSSFAIYEKDDITNELISYCLLLKYNDFYRKKFFFSKANVYNIRCLNVEEKWQNRGYGKRLINFIIKNKEKKDNIYLEVWSYNIIAKKLYAHFFINYTNTKIEKYINYISKLEKVRLETENITYKNVKLEFMKLCL